MSRWTSTSTKKRPSAAEQRVAARERALEQCHKGEHTPTPTFRPGEMVCLVCGAVFYCPDCLDQAHLPHPLVHAYPMTCPTHQRHEVQA